MESANNPSTTGEAAIGNLIDIDDHSKNEDYCVCLILAYVHAI